ncbi:MAG: hypothetical protein Q9182_006273 [Xanthomendoza sp. 2 TL-2023]
MVFIELAIALLVLKFIVDKFKSFRNARRAYRLGCKPLRCPDRNDPFGWRAVRDRRKAMKDHRFPVHQGMQMDQVGKNPHTILKRYPLMEVIMTRDPENIKTILATQVSHWELGQVRRDLFSEHAGRGLHTLEGQAWKNSRSRIRPQFSQASIGNLGLFERHEQDLLLKLAPGTDGWTSTTDLQPLFLRMTLDVITEFIYGQSVYSLNSSSQRALSGSGRGTPPNVENFARCVDEVTDYVASVSPYGKWYKYIPARHFKQSRATVRALVDWYVDRAVEQAATKSEKEPSTSSGFVILDELAKLTDDKLWLRNETLSLLLAGQGPTASLIVWLFYHLARNPSVYHKLRLVILEELGTESGVEHITLHKLRACGLLQNCIHEALRLGSVVPNTARSAACDTTLPHGGGPEGTDPVFVPKGSIVFLAMFSLHHRADIWGEDVEEFKPERWDGRDRTWEFNPFGGGPRACIGQQFAITEVSYVAVRLIQQFDDIQFMDDPGTILYNTNIHNKSATGVKVRLHRSQAE